MTITKKRGLSILLVVVLAFSLLALPASAVEYPPAFAGPYFYVYMGPTTGWAPIPHGQDVVVDLQYVGTDVVVTFGIGTYPNNVIGRVVYAQTANGGVYDIAVGGNLVFPIVASSDYVVLTYLEIEVSYDNGVTWEPHSELSNVRFYYQ